MSKNGVTMISIKKTKNKSTKIDRWYSFPFPSFLFILVSSVLFFLWCGCEREENEEKKKQKKGGRERNGEREGEGRREVGVSLTLPKSFLFLSSPFLSQFLKIRTSTKMITQRVPATREREDMLIDDDKREEKQ